MSVNISGNLPKGDGNGLVAVLSELVRETNTQFVTIALVDCKKVTLDKDTGEKIPTVRVRRIEVLLDADDMKIARRLMERALSARTGQETLPYDLAAEIDGAFGSEDVADYREELGDE